MCRRSASAAFLLLSSSSHPLFSLSRSLLFFLSCHYFSPAVSSLSNKTCSLSLSLSDWHPASSFPFKSPSSVHGLHWHSWLIWWIAWEPILLQEGNERGEERERERERCREKKRELSSKFEAKRRRWRRESMRDTVSGSRGFICRRLLCRVCYSHRSWFIWWVTEKFHFSLGFTSRRWIALILSLLERPSTPDTRL